MRFVESDILDVDSITIMVQKEVGERIVAKESTSDYSALSVAIQIVSDVKYLRTVSKKMFYPIPNVDSAIIKIDINKNKYKINNFKSLKAIIKSAFAMRRKTLINNLSKSNILDKDKCSKLLNDMNLDTRIRGEALSVEQFIELSNLIEKP